MKPKLFIWIPKTSGSSLFETLKSEGMRLWIDNHRDFDNQGHATFGHFDVQELIRTKIISKSYWDSCEPFAVVRNPYERFVSLYHDFRKSGRIMPHMTMKEFAWMLWSMDRQPGLFNAHHFSQTASQVRWIFEGVRVRRFENIVSALPHLNRSTEQPHMQHYDPELLRLVTDLYWDDFVILKYNIIE